MLKMAGRRVFYILGITPFNMYDTPDKNHTAKSFYVQANEGETGWNRLYNMFSVDEFGTRSPEMNFVTQGIFVGSIIGMVYGGSTKARMAYENFIETNQATKFAHTFEAKKKLQDAVTLGFAKGAYQWGWRLGLFTGSYILITTSIAAYRGKSSLIEYTSAGFITAACYKFSLGPRAMLTAGAAGGALGTLAGLLSLGLLKLTGTTMEEVRYWQYNWKKDRERLIQNSMKKAHDPDSSLEKHHNQLVQSTTTEPQKQETKEQSKA